MAGDRREMVILCDKYTKDVKKMQITIEQLQTDAKIIVLEDHGFLPRGINTFFEYFIAKQNREEHEKKGLLYDSLELPGFWEIRMEENQGGIYGLGCKKATVYFKDSAEQGVVQRVEWQTDAERIYRIDYYNKYGLKYASEFLDKDKNVESKVYYSDKNQEVIVSQPQNDVITLLENGTVRGFFNTNSEFVRFCVDAMSEGGRRVLFVQEEACKLLDLEADGENVWDMLLFSQKELLEKYREEKKENGYRFYNIPEQYPMNHVSRNALILTASDQIEKIEEMVQEMPDVMIHIAAHTQVSDKLRKLAERENVRVYPGISAKDLADLWDKCDFYLDINHYREIDDAVNEASQRNLLIMGFENTLHQRELLIRGCIFSKEDYAKMAYVIRYLISDPALMQKFLSAQQKRRREVWNGLFRAMEEKGK